MFEYWAYDFTLKQLTPDMASVDAWKDMCDPYIQTIFKQNPISEHLILIDISYQGNH